jgi:TonB family protein
MPESKEKHPSRKKRFIALPKYAGGSQAFKRFIMDNLSYPDEALEKGIEGDVYIKYTVNNLGDVTGAQIIRSLGFGCDEEALRLVHLLKYEPAKNRGLRVTSSMRTKIPFRLPKKQPQFEVVYDSTPSKDKKPQVQEDQKGNNTYSYTVHYTISPPDPEE